MKDKLNLEQRSERGRIVGNFLDSPEWVGAWDSYREMLIHIIETSEDDDRAMDARRMLRAARKARSHLETLVADAKIAGADIASRRSNLKMN